MHQLQKILLKRLLIQGKQKYSLLTRSYSYEDNILFHLKQLINKGLVAKKDGQYSVTAAGIKGFDLDQREDTGAKTFIIGFLCQEENEYLIKAHPHAPKNFYNLPSGQPRFGEDIFQALARIFFENTNFKINPKNFKFLSLHLKTIKTADGQVLFDDAFAIYEVKIGKNQRNQMKLKKELSWMGLKKIKTLQNRWPEIDILIFEGNRTPYLSYQFKSNYIL